LATGKIIKGRPPEVLRDKRSDSSRDSNAVKTWPCDGASADTTPVQALTGLQRSLLPQGIDAPGRQSQSSRTLTEIMRGAAWSA